MGYSPAEEGKVIVVVPLMACRQLNMEHSMDFVSSETHFSCVAVYRGSYRQCDVLVDRRPHRIMQRKYFLYYFDAR